MITYIMGQSVAILAELFSEDPSPEEQNILVYIRELVSLTNQLDDNAKVRKIG